MALYKDSLPSQTNWLHDLAKGEIHPEADQLLSGGLSGNPGVDAARIVEESTIDFLTELRDYFVQYTKIFNSYGEGGARFQEIKIYSVANTSADFMLFRAQIKLVFSQLSAGVIQIALVRHLPPGMASGISAKSSGHGEPAVEDPPQELHAVVGPFRDVNWTFQNEKVSAEQVAKFYFTEFSKMTRDFKKHRSNNQQLLNQIRTLLNEKGLEL